MIHDLTLSTLKFINAIALHKLKTHLLRTLCCINKAKKKKTKAFFSRQWDKVLIRFQTNEVVQLLPHVCTAKKVQT
jgi:hypothetical protein